jgi:hypothetical protein
MTYPASLVVVGAVSLSLSGCSVTPQPTPRFTHIETRPVPFVMFDQKTRQLCWASTDPAFGGGKDIDVIVTVSEDGQTAQMPRCIDLK